MGVGQDGSVHAMEVAFHGAGLNYGGGADKRVLKKLLRTMLILNAYHPEETEQHILLCFAQSESRSSTTIGGKSSNG